MKGPLYEHAKQSATFTAGQGDIIRTVPLQVQTQLQMFDYTFVISVGYNLPYRMHKHIYVIFSCAARPSYLTYKEADT